MKIYTLREDVNNFQRLLPQNDVVWETDLLTFDCRPKEDWTPPEVYIRNPKLKRGNFIFLTVGALVFDEVARDALAHLLEASGEILPLPCGDETLFLLNVLDCVDALDEARTKWKKNEHSGARTGIGVHEFYENRIPEVPLFKIPQTSRADIYTCSGLKDPDDEFKSAYEAAGFTGLIFDHVWSSA